MENPAYWSEDTKAIQEAIDEYNRQVAAGIFGASLAMIIENRVVVPLREKIKEIENPQEIKR